MKDKCEWQPILADARTRPGLLGKRVQVPSSRSCDHTLALHERRKASPYPHIAQGWGPGCGAPDSSREEALLQRTLTRPSQASSQLLDPGRTELRNWGQM